MIIILFNNSDDDEAKKEFVRSDMMKYISDNNNDARNILIKKATDGTIDDCDQEKSDIYKMTKYKKDKVPETCFSTSWEVNKPQCRYG